MSDSRWLGHKDSKDISVSNFSVETAPERSNAKVAKPSSFKARYKEFAESTSAHGFFWTVQTQCPVRRTFWGLLLLVFLSLAAFSTVSVTRDYLLGPGFSSEYKLVYDTATKELDDSTSERMADFVVCDLSPWDSKKIADQDISIELLSYVAYLMFPFAKNPGLFDSPALLASLEEEYSAVLQRYDNNVVSLLDNITRTCEDTVLWCKLGLNDVS